MSAKPGLAKAGTRGINRAEIVDANFLEFLDGWSDSSAAGDLGEPVAHGSSLTGRELLELLDYQMMSRQIDLVAREMRARNEGFYTIGSSGHEGNVAAGYLSRRTDNRATSESTRHISVRIEGLTGNPTGVGARVRLKNSNDSSRVAEVYAGSGYLSQSSGELFFAVDERSPYTEASIQFANGRTTTQQIGPNDKAIVVKQVGRVQGADP